MQLLPSKQSPLVLDCKINAGIAVSIGDQVSVQLPDPDNGWLRIVIYAYGIPTLGMITGALAGYWSAIGLAQPQYSELASLAGFALGLCGGLFAWARVERSVRLKPMSEQGPESATVIAGEVI